MMNIQKDYNLLAHNTFGIDVRCKTFIEYSSEDDASDVSHLLKESKESLIIIGGGSNLLLTKDYEGTVIHSTTMGHEVMSESADEVLLRVGSGEVWDDIAAMCVTHGWYGAENLSLIPGEVGASAVQNIGAYGAEVSDLIVKVEAVGIADGRKYIFDAADCRYGYRQSRFKHDWKNQYLMTYVIYRLKKTFEPKLDYGNIRAELERRGITKPTACQLREVIIDIRQQKLPDPKVEGNAGSFFMNPIVEREQYEHLQAQYPTMPHYHVDDTHEKIPAGWLIEQCGWKGKTLGRAGVHDKQALVLVNRGGATGQEIVTLCETIRQDVKHRFDIQIEPEVNIIA
jgi:UDP-N-acetylmuramate dehydrogenase